MAALKGMTGALAPFSYLVFIIEATEQALRRFPESKALVH
jgi:hypothetical protein